MIKKSAGTIFWGRRTVLNYLFPNWFLDWVNKVGLPPNHPGVVKG